MSTSKVEPRAALSPLHKALLTIERLEAKLRERASGAREPLAIRSAALRFPGGAHDLASLERLLFEGVDATGEVPRERWDADALYDARSEARGKISTRRGAFVTGVSEFDASFFGISPREALCIDPQQRLLLELAWEALERAGIAPDSLRNTRTGVFVGIGIGDWAVRLARAGDLTDVDAYTGIGTGFAFAAGRVAFHLGLQGPALSVDTACSSSLVALHLAAQSLRAGECDLALVGGAHLMLAPETMVVLSRTGALAPDGRCKTFDARADGYGRGEGCAMLVLSRASDVPRAAPVLGLLRGSAVNHDGPSSALTVPSGPAQQAVLRDALENAGVRARDVGYVEAHGTGTALGDPMEVAALAAVYASERSTPLRIGSLKTNIGHLEAAAGLAGLLKLCLVLARGEIPPHLHLKRKTPHVPWDRLPLEVPTSITPWSDGAARLGGVSAFGLSGTNAHAIVEAPPRAAADELANQPGDGRAQLCVLSARSPEALTQLLHEARAHVEAHGHVPLSALCYSLSACRALLPERVALCASTHQELASALLSRAQRPSTSRDGPRPLAFLFTGQGSPYPGMGRELYAQEPVFRRTVDACDALAEGHLTILPGAAVRGELDAARLTDTALAQPALFTLQVALVELWRSWGITPELVCGHSVGEIAAAYAAHAIDLEQGLRFAIARGRAMGELPRGGAMVSVRADVARVMPLLSGRAGVSLAAVNAPGQTVIAGEREAVQAVVGMLERQGVAALPLTVSHAFHSPLMEPALAAIGAAAPTARAPGLSFVSTLTGRLETAAPGAEYWQKQARGAVLFADAARSLWAAGARSFVEIGPRPTLLALTQSSVADARVLLPSLKPGTADGATMRSALATLVEAGASAVLREVFEEGARRYVQVPTYPFQRESFWVPLRERPEPPRQEAHEPASEPRASATLPHPWLENQVKLASQATQFRTHLSDTGLLAEHRIGGRAVVPLSALVSASLAALHATFPHHTVRLDSLEAQNPLFLPAGEPQELEIVVAPRGDEHATVTFRARDAEAGGEPSEVAAATATLGRGPLALTSRPHEASPRHSGQELPLDELHQALALRGIEHGPSYRRFARCTLGDAELWGELSGPHTLWTVLDLAVQAVGMAALDPTRATLLFPSAVGSTLVGDLAGAASVHARVTGRHAGSVVGEALVLDAEGKVLAELHDLTLVPASVEALLQSGDARLLSYTHELVLRELALAPGELAGTRWLLFSDGGPCALSARRALLERGAQVAQAFTGPAFCELEPGLFELDPASEADHVRLLARAHDALGGAPSGVLWFWGLGARDADGAALALERVLTLARALAQAPEPARLCVVTRGGEPVGEHARDLTIFQSPLRGLGRALAVEHPELAVTLLDLDPAAGADHGHALSCALSSHERELTFREGRALASRLVHAQPGTRERLSSAAPLALRGDASYVVTGGLGGLGLQVVAWLVQHGAGHVAILSRNEPSDAARERLEALGKRVSCHACDVTDDRALAQALRDVEANGKRVAGVVHAAAVIEDALLAQQTPERVRRVLAPKLQGTVNLARALKGHELQFFFCFSSLVSLMGAAGQLNYAAANAFVDAFAARERARGKPVTSVQWGPWAGAGTAQTLADQRRWAELGLSKIAPSLGLRAIERALAAGLAGVAVLPIAWPRFFERISPEATPPLYAELSAVHRTQAPPLRARDEALLAALAHAGSAEARGAILLAHVRREAAAILRLKSPEALSVTRPLNELGFDSLLAVELRNAVQQSLGLTVRVSALFEHPTLSGLAEYLARDGQMPRTPARDSARTAGPRPLGTRTQAQVDLSLIYFASGMSGPEHDKYRHVREQARFADEAGFKAIWIPERHFFEFGALYPEPSILAAALATITSRVRLRAGSTVLPLHHPLQLAERWAMVDNLSNGRVDLSVATGWSPLDFVFAPERYAERLRVMRESTDMLRRLWRGESVKLVNGQGEPAEVRAFPRPVQPELPLWYTCSGGLERFEEAGRAGANVLTALLFQSYEQLGEKIAAYRAARRSAGHDPEAGCVTLMLHTYLDEDGERVIPTIHAPFVAYLASTAKVWLEASSEATVRNVESMSEQERNDVLEVAFGRYVHTAGLFGTPESARARFAELAALGVNEVACLVDFGVAPELVQSCLRCLARLLPRTHESELAPEMEELVL